MAKDYVVNITGKDNLSATLKGVKQELKDTAGSAAAIDNIRRKFEQIQHSTQPLKTQLRQLNNLMGQMKSSGLASTYADEFNQITAAAGRTKQQMNQVSAAITRAASKTPILDQMGTAFNGISAAANLATGAMGLFGTENENVQRAILQVQSVVAAGMGFSQLIPVLKAAKAAQLGFNRVLNNNPYVIAAAAIIGLGTAIYKFIAANNKAVAASDTYIAKVNAIKKLNEDSAKAYNDVTNSVAKEKNQIDALNGIIHNNSTSLAQKKKAINDLKSIIPSYNAKIDAEGTVHDNAATSIRNHIKALDDLQKAIAAYKVGEKIQENVSNASFEAYKAGQKVQTKQNNVNAVNRELNKNGGNNEYHTRTYIPANHSLGEEGHWQTVTTSKGDSKAKELKIQQDAVKTAQTEKKTADLKLKTAQEEQRQYNNWKKGQGSADVQAIVARNGGDFQKSADELFRRNQKTTGTGGKGGGKGGSGKGGHTGNTESTKADPVFKADAETIEDMENNISILEDKLKKLNPNAPEFEQVSKEIDSWKDKLTAVENKYKKVEEKKPTFESGSIADYQDQIAKIEEQLQNQNLSMDVRLNLITDRDNLEQQAEALINPLKIKEDAEKEAEEAEKERAKQQEERRSKQIEGYEAIGSAASAMGQLMSAAGADGAAAAMQLVATTANATAQMIPQILALIGAKEGEAMASGTASAAALPFPANIAAIASIIATVVGTFASIFSTVGAFADGGIIQGASTHGDQLLARVNAGEMILNGSQQARLFNLLDGAGAVGGAGMGQVSFKIKGSDLYGSLSNYSKVKAKSGLKTGIK